MRGIALVSVLAALLTLAPRAAGTAAATLGHELMLEGPHPFLRQNTLSVQYLLGTGFGDSFSGQGMGLAYGYALQGPLWLDLELNFRGSTCPPWQAQCRPPTGNDVEILAGGAWRFLLGVPVVPFVHANAGLLFLYPDGSTSAFGLGLRGGGGAKYYVYDWLGFGVQAALSLGHGFFVSQYPSGHTYAVIDFGLATEVQF